jgi:hypothetical protein
MADSEMSDYDSFYQIAVSEIGSLRFECVDIREYMIELEKAWNDKIKKLTELLINSLPDSKSDIENSIEDLYYISKNLNECKDELKQIEKEIEEKKYRKEMGLLDSDTEDSDTEDSDTKDNDGEESENDESDFSL